MLTRGNGGFFRATLALADGISVTTGSTKTADATLATGPQIKGTVTDEGGKGIPNASVTIYASGSYSPYEYITADSAGKFASSGLAAGDYAVSFSATDYISEYWDNKAFSNDATPITITNADVTLVPALTKAAKITGKVTDADGKPVVNAPVYASTSNAGSSTSTDSNGQYTLSYLREGSYKVRFGPAGILGQQWYKNSATEAGATSVAVTAGNTVSDIDASLQEAGSIAGTVTGSDKKTISGTTVSVQGVYPFNYWASTTTGADGKYVLPGLSDGKYRVQFTPASGSSWLGEYYNNKSSYSDANPVEVLNSAKVTGIDAELARGAVLSGTVTSDTGPLSSAYVSVSSTSGQFYSSTYTSSNGTWSMTVPAGVYTLRFSSSGFVSEWYDNALDQSAATAITVAGEETKTGLDARLDKGGSISGTVTGDKGSISYGWVYAYRDGSTNSYASSYLGSNGKYTITGLPEGSYKLQFSASGFLSEYWNDQEDIGSATSITVGKAQDVTGKDAVLTYGAAITGKVVDTQGNPVSRAFVSVYRKDHEYGYFGYGYTADDGTFRVGGLPSGAYRVSFQPGGRDNPFINEWYKDKVSFDDADDVSLSKDQERTLDVVTVSRGSRITGVVKDTNGNPVAGVDVYASSPSDSGEATTDAQGAYTVTALTAGDYRLRLDPPQGVEVASQYWDGVATLYGSKKITVPAEQTVTVNPVMKKGASISGTVKSATGVVQSGVQIDAYGDLGNRYRTTTGPDGKYTVTGMAPGAYSVSFTGPVDYWKQWYNGEPARGMSDPVKVDFGTTLTDVDAALTDASYIAGVITDDAQNPVPNMPVWIYRANSSRAVSKIITDASGVYRSKELEPGTYSINVRGLSSPSLAPLWYPAADDRRDGEDVVVVKGKPTVASMQLAKGGSISGRLTADGSPVASGTVTVQSATRTWQVNAAPDGTYMIGGLPADKYTVYAWPGWSNNLLGRYYSNKYDPAQADLVTVSKSADVANINFALTPGGSIAGKTTTSDGKAASGQITAYRKSADGTFEYSTSAPIAADGTYRIGRLAPGDYKLNAQANPYQTQWWNAKPDIDTATVVTVAQDSSVTGKDFALVMAPAIKGRVVTADGKPLPPYTQVYAYKDNGDDEWYDYFYSATVAADGTYVLGVPSGDYKIRAYPGYYNSIYSDIWWNNKATLKSADLVTLANSDVTGIDFTLPTQSRIAGSVRLPQGYSSNARVELYTAYGDQVDTDYVSSGSPTFAFRPVVPGSYLLHFAGSGVLSEWWQDKASQQTATTIKVAAGEDVTGLVAVLDRGAAISGSVMDPKSQPLGAEVDIYDASSGDWVGGVETDPDGKYTVGGLGAGQYLVRFDPFSREYATQWFAGAAKRAQATSITLAGNGSATADATMFAGATLTGKVTDEKGEALAGASVTAETADHNMYSVLSNVRGDYTFSGLDADTYTVHVKAPSSRLDLLPEWYDNAETLEEAKPLDLTSGSTSTANVQLAQGATVNGVVTGPNNNPVRGVGVDVFNKDGEKSLTAWTDSSGRYRSTGLLPGSYTVRFKPGYYGGKGLVEQWWEKQPTQAQSVAVTLNAGQQRTGIDAKLASVGNAVAPGAPTEVTATASDSKVTVKWKAPASDGGLPVTKYEVSGKPWGSCITYGALECSISVDNDVTYTFSVRASTDAGLSPFSAASAPVTPLSAKPKAPTGVTATAGVESATVRWTPGSGAPASSYTVTSWPHNKTCTATSSSCVVTGLTAGQLYTFTVVASNDLGDSPASAASNPVTPTAPSGGGGGGGGGGTTPTTPPPPPPGDGVGGGGTPPATGGGGGTTTPNPTPPPRVSGAKTKVKGKKVTVTWRASAGATSYQVRTRKGKKTSAWRTVSGPKFRASLKKGTYVLEIRPLGPGGTGPVTRVKFKTK